MAWSAPELVGVVEASGGTLYLPLNLSDATALLLREEGADRWGSTEIPLVAIESTFALETADRKCFFASKVILNRRCLKTQFLQDRFCLGPPFRPGLRLL